MNTRIDTSQELILNRLYNGIILMRPDKKHIYSHKTGYRVADIFKLPFNVYFIDTNGIHINMNENNAESFWASSVNSAIGKNIFNIAKKSSANRVTAQNKSVINSGNKSIIEDEIYKNNNHYFTTLTLRLPWYGDDRKIVGIFGCSIALGKQLLDDSLSQLSKMGLLSQNSTINNKFNLVHKDTGCIVPIYPQQIKCLKLLIDGNSDKKIAEQLNLSCRTVNHYLHHLRRKLGCRNSREMIATYFSQVLSKF